MTMTPCHREKYAEAIEGMRQYVSRMFPGPLPEWARAAAEQHAHYYASKACGEETMRFSNYQTRAALGITRMGQPNGQVLRTISMAGFNGFGAPPPANAGEFTTYAASNVLDEGCIRASKQPDGTKITAPGSSFCQCMYGDVDRIDTVNKNSSDFRAGSPRNICQLMAEYNFPPWSDDSLLAQIVGSMGQADPLKSLPTGEKIAAYKKMIENVGEKEIGIPGTPLSFKLKEAGGILEQVGAVPAGSITGAQKAGSTALDIDAYRAQVRARADVDLVGILEQFKASPPDPISNPQSVALLAAAIEENNYRAANPCPAGQSRTTRFPLDADGRASCDPTIRRRPGVGTGTGLIRPVPLPPNLVDVLVPGGKGGGASAGSNTALLVGGGIAVVAALFLLKR